jgi:AraC-like DNA-binding protein
VTVSENKIASDLSRLAQLISTYAPHDGRFELSIPGACAIRLSQPTPGKVHSCQKPGMCIIAQGAKTVILGQNTYEYDEPRLLVYSLELPITSQVTRASLVEPYLCFTLDIDPQRISELVLKIYPHGLPKVQGIAGLNLGPNNPHIVQAVIRLLELLEQPGDAVHLAPLIFDEILIRLLRSPIGAYVAQMGITESSLYKVGKAIDWIRSNFAESMKVEELAELVHMSPSSFHQHFKSVTSLSPLQFQKALRLQEARRLMASMVLDVSEVSLRVGYLSVSQFSREYSRFFGCSPSKDIAHLQFNTENSAEVESAS